jgi:hypothetical protein
MQLLRRSVLLLALFAVGCGSDGPLSVQEARALVAARARWEASPLREAYVYEVRYSCFCPPEFLGWNTVTVSEGRVVGVRTDAGVTLEPSDWSRYPTVDDLFDRILPTESDGLADIVLRFDPEHGYPVEISYISKPEIADGFGATFTRNLRPMMFVPGPAGGGG